MAFWRDRNELSLVNRLRRSYYELLRDELDQYLLKYALIDSYANFTTHKEAYPFVEKRELKPRARIPDLEYDCQNAFLVIFVEDSLPSSNKKFIRFYDLNRTTKRNLLRSKSLRLSRSFDRSIKFADAVHFDEFLYSLLPVDYALLIQRQPASHGKERYSLSHFHVRIDWPIAEAAEDLSHDLRYVSKDLYEKGDKYAEDLQKKFFDYYCLPPMAGGRRTAAIVAAQYLRKIGCMATVYAASSESRALFRINENTITKQVLIKMTKEAANQIATNNSLTPAAFRRKYAVGGNRRYDVCILRATYAHTEPALPPADGKLRELKPDLNWVTVASQAIIPKPGTLRYPPLPTNYIYS
jgi:hypothetical protein